MASTRVYDTKAGKRHAALWRDESGRSQQKRGFRKEREALAHAVKAEEQERRGAGVRGGEQLLSACLDEWAEVQDWKSTTRQSWPPQRRRILEGIGDRPINTIRRSDLTRLRQQLIGRYAHSTATVTLTMARKVLRDAFEDRRIDHDPGVGVRVPRNREGRMHPVGPEQVPTTADVLDIWQAAPSRFRAAIALGASGLRLGEVLGCHAEQVDVTAGTVLVDRQLQRCADGGLEVTTPKAEKSRLVQLPQAAVLELRRHVHEHQGGGLLFRGPRSDGEGMRKDQFYRQAWQPALVGAGLDARRYRYHSLRHWCASSMLAEGLPVTAVASHIGDTVEVLLQVYSHWLRDDRTVTAAVLDRLLVPAADLDEAVR